MDRKAMIGLGAGALALVLLVTIFGRGGGAVPQLDGEPNVNLVVDAETGETRQLSIEEYIKGVVAAEMGRVPEEGGEAGDWPHAAYAAQAILARTFALTFLNEQGVVDISADIEEAQAYNAEAITSAIERAVDETRGVVMAHDGEFVKAWFHSYSGGHTATAQEGLNYQDDEPGFVLAREMPENEVVPQDTRYWGVEIPIAEVQQALSEAGVNVGTLREVSVAEWGPSGRATTLNVTGTGGSAQMHASQFRLAVGSERMKSTRLGTLEVRGDTLVASGTGFGHGVGLSQWDAYQMAQNGRSPEQIIRFFFRDVQVGRAWQ